MTAVMLRSPHSRSYQPLADKAQHSLLTSPTSHWTVPALVKSTLISALLTTFHWVTVSCSKRRKLVHTPRESRWKPNPIHNVTLHNVRFFLWDSSATYSCWTSVFALRFVEECENWLPGVYNVTIQICNGECGSQHPHSAIYDTGKGSFTLTG